MRSNETKFSNEVERNPNHLGRNNRIEVAYGNEKYTQEKPGFVPPEILV